MPPQSTCPAWQQELPISAGFGISGLVRSENYTLDFE
ncbi:hypothetical protein CDHC01_1595 [Corynebacterium diphtheriae HC01]|nr:hypothetical protein CD241_1593 [Corynebacterium diphtheriae 241]AEX74839.1 hypothetical protein CDHC01_1595 [Corynebacterium diphtheriae HC01]